MPQKFQKSFLPYYLVRFLILNLLGSIFLTIQPSISAAEPAVSRIAFGSCAKQDKPQPIWEAIFRAKPDLFLMLGDNIYVADTTDPSYMAAEYEKLGKEKMFSKIRESIPILATWDDNDYGAKDGGGDYPGKEKAKELFLNFFGAANDDPRRDHPGVYYSKYFGSPRERVQVIMLDTRYFRSPLKKKKNPKPGLGPYEPEESPSATVLGQEQWQWLEKELRQPAVLRVLVSSIQVLADEHGYETWGNFPKEREKLFKIITEAKASGVIILSGDRHQAELTLRKDILPYPLYDLTSSSFNSPRPPGEEPNHYRVHEKYNGPNFGLVEIDWDAKNPIISISIRDVKGEVVFQSDFPLKSLEFTKQALTPYP